MELQRNTIYCLLNYLSPVLSLILMLGASPSWSQESCRQALIKSKIGLKVEVFSSSSNNVRYSSRKIEGLVEDSGRQMYYRLDKANIHKSKRKTETVVLFHGLGDHSGRVNGLAEGYLKRGYDVLRVDLFGFGRTLQANLELGNKIPDVTPIQWQSQLALKVLQVLDLKDIRLAGHSYGGAVALVVGSEINYPIVGEKKQSIRIGAIDLFGFYALDLLDYAVANLATAGMQKKLVDDLLSYTESVNPGSRYVTKGLGMAHYLNMRVYQEVMAFFQFFGVKKATEIGSDPYLSRFMKISYEPYFEYLANNAGLEISHEVKKQIQLQVESAISVTIGARWFNVFHPRQSLPALNVPINVVAGMQDELVPLQLLQEASQLLIRKGYSVNFQTIEGGHLFPFKNPKETLDLIIK